MPRPAFTFDEIMAPLGVERFFAEYEGRKPLHLKGRPDKFAEVMTWAKLGDLLSQATIWSQGSLLLVLDKKSIAAASYCASAPGRDGGQVMRPDPGKVQEYLRRGATLIANDVDHLNVGMTAFAHAMEQALGGKVQGNLYLSSRRRQGFAAHFDTHDVYAVHVEGTKTWHVYEGRAADPIAHLMFKSYGQEHHDKAKGELLMDVHMEPGDLLYLPRGQYHDAIADEGGAVHIAFGITYPIGLDIVTMLFERMMREPIFRANLPRLNGAGDDQALTERLRVFADSIATALAEPKMVEQVKAMQRGFHYPRHAYKLPALLAESADERYRVRGGGIRMVQQGGRFGLVREGERAATEVPADVSAMVGWVLERQQFSRHELAQAFPDRGAGQLDNLLRDLGAMRLTEPIV
jgi:bifunctional lysine-specific demethylase and histidyl-hydroxylase MINA